MIHKYPDGSSYAKIEQFKKEFTFRINSYEDLWHLKQITDAYLYNSLIPTITIPNLLDAQADDRFGSNESFGLKLVCEFLNGMAADFRIFHPHNPQIVKALMNNVAVMDNFGFIGRVLSEFFNGGRGIHGEYQENLILFSSDAGGFKPLMKLTDKLQWKGEVYGASKSRKYEDGKSKLVQVIDRQDFGGKDILIVDDMCLYGGTFIGLAKMLKERNVGKLYLAVSHLTVENPNPELFSLFDHVFTTNSKYDEYFPIPMHDGGGSIQAENLTVVKLF